MNENNQIIIYQTEDGQTQVDVRMENDTVWLSATDGGVVSNGQNSHCPPHQQYHKMQKLEREATCAKIAQVKMEGNRKVTRHKQSVFL